jgi:hypothetical protein
MRRRLLLVTHRSIHQAGGPAARWRAFFRYLPEYGWELDVLSADEGRGASEFDTSRQRAVATRAAAMARIARLSDPAFRFVGVRPDSLPLSMLWIPRGALLLRRQIALSPPDVVLATGPPIAGLLAARVGIGPHIPLVVELRDLWAGNPAFDAGGKVLSKVEDWMLRGAHRVVACTPEAVSDLRIRHPQIAGRVVEIPNGFDPEVRSIATSGASGNATTGSSGNISCAGGSRKTLTLLHSGTVTATRPLAPLIRALCDPRVSESFHLVLHGYMSPTSRAEVEQARGTHPVSIELLPPSPWRDAVCRIARADAGVITQARGAGDETAIASKIYEYLALEKPVLCVTDGGASEALLRRLGADELCARLDEPETILAALLRLRDRPPRPVAPPRLEPYNRRELAGQMATLLESVARKE